MPNGNQKGPKSVQRFLTTSLAFMLTCLVVNPLLVAGNDTIRSAHSRSSSTSVAPSNSSLSDHRGGNEKKTVESNVNWQWIGQLRKVHPLVFAAAMLLTVIGTCLLLTDNKELELYLKIDFRPPKVDILN